MLGRLEFNALAAFTLAITALIGAYLPVLLSSRDKQRGGSGRSLGYVLGNMLSAGVMVSAGFCHLLGDALEQMPAMDFPLAPFLCGVGFLLTLLCDAAVVHASSGPVPGCHGAGLVGGAAARSDGDLGLDPEAQVDPARRRRQQRQGPASEGTADGVQHPTPRAHPALSQRGPHAKPGGVDTGPAPKDGGAGSPLPASPAAPRRPPDTSPFELEAGGGQAGPPRGAAFGAGDGEPAAHEAAPLLSHAAGPDGAGSSVLPAAPKRRGGHSVTFATAILLGVALCFHSVLEGAAMGAQATVSASMHIFIAVVSHKGLAAYALGSSVVDSDVSPARFWSVVGPFTLASPLGIFVGYVVSDLAAGTGAASISSMAAGTFLYVAFMEVIPKELDDKAHTLLKLAALATGYGLMSVLAIWA
ncbi:Zinc transporter ZIP1 [Auxenochlorella protothecoides]|uniref:Zinc transporter ZIP1 n=3 Tax=Auxenochlorella protothecoides TaxID=3075 RepID=A0A087SKJ1_AUXPR|nr:Zinc transporter ZIP1 [Auxenochlorella protothecoides]KFM26245.1 Zinc transporter ZIP1 [Auxenochlorella protothecoides]